jgi:hypothetical protein
MRCIDRIDSSASNHPLPMAIAPHDLLITALPEPGWRDFLELTKPKVSSLIVFTAIVGMVLASPGMVVPSSVIITAGCSRRDADYRHLAPRI